MPHPQTAPGRFSGSADQDRSGRAHTPAEISTMPHAGTSTPTRSARRGRGVDTPGTAQPVALHPKDQLGARPDQVQLRARRSPKLIALGLLLACLGGLGGALLLQTSAHTSSVLVMAHSVAKGATISASDLTSVSMGTAPIVASLPASDLGHIVGQVALVDLPAGSLPGPRSVGTLSVPLGDTQLGLKLAAGRVPSTRLDPGTAVLLVPVSASANEPAPSGAPVTAIVVSTPQQVSGDAVVIDVAVAPAQATAVAQWAARGAVSMVRQGQK